jgi:hypothetical protein
MLIPPVEPQRGRHDPIYGRTHDIYGAPGRGIICANQNQQLACQLHRHGAQEEGHHDGRYVFVQALVPSQASDGIGGNASGGGGGQEQPPRCSSDHSQASGAIRNDNNAHATRPKDGAMSPAGGMMNSRDNRAHSKTPTPVPTPWPSQAVRDEQRHGVGGSERPHGKGPVDHPQDAQGQHAPQCTGYDRPMSQVRDGAAS